jgi:geranylgeranyl pyrophosphate synthase
LVTLTFNQLIREQLNHVEEIMRAEVTDAHPNISSAIEHLLASGGKRIRPSVVLLVGNLLESEPESLAIMAAAVEMLHTATLIHDDLIDGALFRRGASTLNNHWSPATTVLIGDYVFSRAANLASKAGSIRAMRMFADALSTIVNGEINQMFSRRTLTARDDYYRRIYAKTASLFETASSVAAILSDVDEAMIQSAGAFGHDLGMAFQIIDDVLDFTGEQATVGKPVASDLRQGLITLPAIYYLEAHPQDEEIKAVLNGGRSDEERILRLLESIRASGAVRQSLEEAHRFLCRGLDALDDLPDGLERSALRKLGSYIVDRDI